MTKQERKLFNDVQQVLKALYLAQSRQNVKVVYNGFKQIADIYWPPDVNKTSNGHSKFYQWEIIDALKEVTDRYSISYKIGYDTDNFELVIQIYVA